MTWWLWRTDWDLNSNLLKRNFTLNYQFTVTRATAALHPKMTEINFQRINLCLYYILFNIFINIFFQWSGRWEPNPRNQLGRLTLYRWVTPEFKLMDRPQWLTILFRVLATNAKHSDYSLRFHWKFAQNLNQVVLFMWLAFLSEKPFWTAFWYRPTKCFSWIAHTSFDETSISTSSQ